MTDDQAELDYCRDNGLCPKCHHPELVECPDAPGYQLCPACGEVS